MASKPDRSKTQHQRFLEAAKKLGADTDAETFRNIVRKVATANTVKKKASRDR